MQALGVDLPTIQSIVGHADLDMTQHYLHVQSPVKQKAVKAFDKACGRELPYVIDPRRPGDVAQCYSDPSKAKDVLGWSAEYTIEDMCRDAWNWQSHNPDGYVE